MTSAAKAATACARYGNSETGPARHAPVAGRAAWPRHRAPGRPVRRGCRRRGAPGGRGRLERGRPLQATGPAWSTSSRTVSDGDIGERWREGAIVEEYVWL